MTMAEAVAGGGPSGASSLALLDQLKGCWRPFFKNKQRQPHRPLALCLCTGV